MTTAPYPQVTNELLSAYIDEAVTEEERRLIEQAVAEDVDVAWRLESLRATVRLLRELPALSLPRSFVLTPEQLGQAAAATEAVAAAAPRIPAAPARRQVAEEGSGFWHDLRRGWGRFWQGGSPAMRNAMAASFAVLMVLLIGPRFLANTPLTSLGTVETAASQAPIQAVAQAPAAKQPAATSVSATKQSAPAAGEQTGEGTNAEIPAAPPEPTQSADVKASPQQAEAEPAGAPQAETAAQATASSAASTSDAAVQGSGPSNALAAGAPPGAQAGPSMGSPSGSAAMDAAQAASGGVPPALAAGPRTPGGRESAAPPPGAAQVTAPEAPISVAASAGLASAYAVTSEADTASAAVAGASAAGEGAEPLAAADTQKIQTTPVATVAAASAAAEIKEQALISTPLEAAKSEPATPAAVAAAASSNSAPAAVQNTAAEQMPRNQGGIPAWAALSIQTAAIIAALATLIFAILWWRSRRLVPPA